MSVSFEPTPETRKIIENISKAGKFSLRQIFGTIGDIYRKEVKMVFDRQQPRGEGMKWPPLSPEYASRKLKKYGNKPMLRATDTLYDSMTEEGSKGNISTISENDMTFGSTVHYGIYHDNMIDARKKIPLRNFSEPSERGVARMKTTLEIAIIKQIENSGIKVDSKGVLL